MSRPMILIGIGTSGLRILEQTQRFYYESMKISKPDYVEYLYLETNKDNYPVAGQENTIKRVYISLSQMERMVADLQTSTKSKWLPPSEQIVNAGMGAGGIRPVGRLALWGKNDEVGSNFRNVFESIQNAYQKVSSHVNKDSKDTSPVVYILGSLTGGTGSGVFIDMAYIIREIVPNTKEVFGLFLIPNRPIDMTNEEVKYANTFGALKDLEEFNKSNTVYSERWPSGKNVQNNKPPYELVQIISQDYKDGSAPIRSLNGLYKMAGLYMFLNVLGMHQKRMERLVDASGNFIIGKYGTFGLSGIHFPKDQIQEHIAVELSQELFERWTDANQYILNNETQAINHASISKTTQNKWDGFLTEAFKNLNTVGGQDLISQLEDEAAKINDNLVGNNKEEYIRKLFSSKNTDQLYGIVQGNLQSAVDAIIDRIYDFNNETLNRYQNLCFSKEVLQGLAKAIERCLNYWRSLGITHEPSRWDDRLRAMTKWVLQNRYSFIFEQNSVVTDRILTVFEQMKMHLMFSKLQEIQDYIEKKETPYRSMNSQKELPKVKRFDELITVVRQVMGVVDSGGKNITLRSRINEIEIDVSDTTIPILRVFPSGSFARETQNAKSVYFQKTNQKKPSHPDITPNNLWEFLLESSLDLNTMLYQTAIRSYKVRVDELNCVGDYKVEDFVSRNAEEVVKMAKRGLSGFISVDKTLDSSSYLPRMIVGNERSKILDTIKTLESQNLLDFKDNDNNILALPNLKNLLVFYDEKGNFIPIKDLSYISQMQEVYAKKPDNLATDEVTDEMWEQYRKAYISQENTTTKKKTDK